MQSGAHCPQVINSVTALIDSATKLLLSNTWLNAQVVLLQGMEQSCAAMVQNLQSNYSSFCSPSPANLQPVLQGQGHHQGQHQAQQQQKQQRHLLLAAASRDSPRADSPARLGSREPSGHSDAAGRSSDLGEGSPRVGGQKGGGLASLITSRGVASPVAVHRLAAATVPASHDPADGEVCIVHSPNMHPSWPIFFSAK